VTASGEGEQPVYRDLETVAGGPPPYAYTAGGGVVRRALLVGIDRYDEFRPLTGCVNDVRAVSELLASHDDGSPNFDCQVLADPSVGVSRDQLRSGVERLFAPGADIALLYVAGHGIHRNNDLVIATTDGTGQSPGVTMTEVMGAIADPNVLREVVIILDCCFAGAAGGVPHLLADVAALRTGVSILTASRGDQMAAETADRRGLFSTMFCGALAGGAADVIGKVSVSGLYAYLSECFGPWDQRPTLKANIDRVHDLRRCAPSVPVQELRRLPELFVAADYELPLDPSYEPDASPAHPEHEADFALLQRARAAKLVEPVGTPHLYFAAMERRSCRLTPLGRHYRMLAEQRRI
jgi:hypothetical protein